MPKKINIMEKAGLMTDNAFREIWQQAIDAPDEDAFVSAAECPDADLLTTKDQLSRLWHVAHDDFRTLLERFGMTQTMISTHFCIPFSTVRKWACEIHPCPTYLRLMMAEALGYITLRDIHP